MNDYSEVTCHLQKDVVNLINALNDKKWKNALHLVSSLIEDSEELREWIYPKAIRENKNEPY